MLSTEQSFLLREAVRMLFRGWALAIQGQGEAGMVQVRRGIAAFRATGAALGVPYYGTVLAEASAHLNYPEDGPRRWPRPTP